MVTEKTLNVLIVEDSPEHTDLLCWALEGEPLVQSITSVADGEQALDYLLHRGVYADVQANPRPDVVLLDLKLPKVSGHEVHRTIRSQPDLQDIIVIILTSSRYYKDMQTAEANAADGYLVKPFRMAEFKAILAPFLHR
jgi:two-component system, response regulator